MRVDALALAASATGICTRARTVMAIANATAGKESKRGMEEVVTRSMIGDGVFLVCIDWTGRHRHRHGHRHRHRHPSSIGVGVGCWYATRNSLAGVEECAARAPHKRYAL